MNIPTPRRLLKLCQHAPHDDQHCRCRRERAEDYEDGDEKHMNLCKTCIHWERNDIIDGFARGDRLIHPEHPVTYEPMTDDQIREAYGHLLRHCKNPRLKFYEYPERGAAAVVDGSEYYGSLVTSEDFGCVMHEHG